MAKLFVALSMILIIGCFSCFAQVETGKAKLIQVKPSYQAAAYSPQGNRAADVDDPNGPTPREQMYVFWLLGKILSYPIDSAEAFIQNRLARPPDKTGPEAQPKVADPFDAVSLRDIPPAPPALGAQASD